MTTSAHGTAASVRLIDRPLTLTDSVIAPNRLQLAPMTNRLSGTDGASTAEGIDWYRGRGAAGFGTVVTGGISVSPEGQLHPDQPRGDDDRFVPALRRLAEGRHPGTLMIAQLLHGGLRVNPFPGSQVPPLGPSSGDGVRGLTAAEIEQTLEDFVRTAARAVEAGFDGVEIHAAHGYLPAQFLSREENRRTDRYGGDFSGRSRFVLELVERMRAALGDGPVLQLRISAEDMRQSRGIDLDESAEIAVLAAERGADVISLSIWDIHKPAQKHPHTTPAAHVKARLGDRAPLVIAGKIWDAADVELAFDQGADMLAIGRAAIFNREIPDVLRNPESRPVRPPETPAFLAGEDVPAPFIAHLQHRWPQLFADAAEGPRR